MASLVPKAGGEAEELIRLLDTGRRDRLKGVDTGNLGKIRALEANRSAVDPTHVRWTR